MIKSSTGITKWRRISPGMQAQFITFARVGRKNPRRNAKLAVRSLLIFHRQKQISKP
jgi:hypothetical protein